MCAFRHTIRGFAFVFIIIRVAGESAGICDVPSLEGHVGFSPGSAIGDVSRVGTFSLLSHFQVAGGRIGGMVFIKALEFGTVVEGDAHFLTLEVGECNGQQTGSGDNDRGGELGTAVRGKKSSR